MSLRKKIAMAALGVGVVLVATPTLAFSASNSLPAGTKVTGKLKAGTDMTFDGTINGVPIVVTCTSFVGSGTVPKTGATSINIAPPKITGCTDDFGGKDTIKDNSTDGKWKLTANTTKPYTMTLTIPEKGATFTSTDLPGCLITAAPSAADPVKGSYNSSSGTVTVKKGGIPTLGSGNCTSTKATTSATIVLKPNPGPPPF